MGQPPENRDHIQQEQPAAPVPPPQPAVQPPPANVVQPDDQSTARRGDRIALYIWLIAFFGLFILSVVELIISLFTFHGTSP